MFAEKPPLHEPLARFCARLRRGLISGAELFFKNILGHTLPLCLLCILSTLQYLHVYLFNYIIDFMLSARNLAGIIRC